MHPMLVHFPIVFWSCAVAADVVGIFSHAELAAGVAFGTLALGCVSGLLAMIVGVLDFLDVPKDSPAARRRGHGTSWPCAVHGSFSWWRWRCTGTHRRPRCRLQH